MSYSVHRSKLIEQLALLDSDCMGDNRPPLNDDLAKLRVELNVIASRVRAPLEKGAFRFDDACRQAIDRIVMLAELESPSKRSEGFRVENPEETAASELNVKVGFRQLQHHASGGLGDVYVAKDMQLERQVAIKFIRPDSAKHPERVARFMREARIAGLLEHPGSVPVYALGADESGRPGYAMRLVQGETLRAALLNFHRQQTKLDRFQSLEFRQLLSRFISVCQTIGYAHERGVVHRDLKPSNIVLGKFGETIVVDWGLARVFRADSQSNLVEVEPNDEQPPINGEEPVEEILETTLSRIKSPNLADQANSTMRGTLLGTLGFLSPEQASGDPDATGPHSDIYGLGATLYAILTGQCPHRGSTVREVLSKITIGDFSPPRAIVGNVPWPLQAISLKAMQLRPENRYSLATDLAEDLERWLADEPISSYRESLTEYIGRTVRKHKSVAAVVLVATAAFLIIVFSAAMLLLRQQEQTQTARVLAAANLRTAMSAIDRLLTRVSNDRLLHEPGAEPLRVELLEQSLQFLESLRATRDQSDTPELLKVWAHATLRVAEVRHLMKSPDDAIPLFQEAIEILRKSAISDEERIELARAYQLLGAAHITAGQFPQALGTLETSLEMLRQVSLNNSKRETITALADVTSNYGTALVSNGRIEEGLNSTEQATQLYDSLLSVPDPDAKHYAARAKLLANQAVMYRMLRRLDQVAHRYEASLRDSEIAIQLEPGNEEFRLGLATTTFNLANFNSALGKQPEAIAMFTKAQEVYERLHQEFPLRHTFRIHLAKAYLNLGIAQARYQLPEQAEATFRKSISQYQPLVELLPNMADPAIDLVQAWQNLGNVIAGEQYERDPGRSIQAYDESIALGQQMIDSNAFPTATSQLSEIVDASRKYRDEAARQ